MYKKIAVEDGITNIKQALQAAGYQTTSLESNDFYNVKAVVVKGDTNEAMISEKNVKLPVVNAAGRSADEVVNIINDRLN